MSLNDETSLYFDLMKLAYIVRDPSLSIPVFFTTSTLNYQPLLGNEHMTSSPEQIERS